MKVIPRLGSYSNENIAIIQWHNYKTVTYKDGTAQSRNGQISEPNKKLKNYENQTEPILRLGWLLRLGTNQETLCTQYHEIPANF